MRASMTFIWQHKYYLVLATLSVYPIQVWHQYDAFIHLYSFVYSFLLFLFLQTLQHYRNLIEDRPYNSREYTRLGGSPNGT